MDVKKSKVCLSGGVALFSFVSREKAKGRKREMYSVFSLSKQTDKKRVHFADSMTKK